MPIMAIEEESSAQDVQETTLLKPIELKDIGFLQKQPTHIHCPSCQTEALSVVRLEAATCWQRFLNATRIGKSSWGGRNDINHYCSACGCFIGRFLEVGCSERCISQRARKLAARDAMIPKTKSSNCADYAQKSRQRVKENRAKKKAEKEAQKAKKAEEKRTEKRSKE